MIQQCTRNRKLHQFLLLPVINWIIRFMISLRRDMIVVAFCPSLSSFVSLRTTRIDSTITTSPKEIGIHTKVCGWFLFQKQRYNKRSCCTRRNSNTALASGKGIATNYTWQEEAFEIDVIFHVPLQTRANDVQFKATSQAIDLRIKPRAGQSSEEIILMDISRKLRGRINLDGTYWVISDVENGSTKDVREITVTIEKLIRTPKDDFEVLDYDWKGIYAKEDTNEVVERKYDKPEELNVREYAANMGVDIDNINMSMVDKSMFGLGANISDSALRELDKAGYITKEITQQADGSEFTMNEETGEPEPFSKLGNIVGSDEKQSSTIKPKKIPFVDTDSPWHKAVPFVKATDPTTNSTYFQQVRNFTRAAFAQDSAIQQQPDRKGKVASTKAKKKKINNNTARDPIDLLTVKRLKEILKSQGLKVSGTKQELQNRLRQQVNSLLQGKSSVSE